MAPTLDVLVLFILTTQMHREYFTETSKIIRNTFMKIVAQVQLNSFFSLFLCFFLSFERYEGTVGSDFGTLVLSYLSLLPVSRC